MISLCYMTKLSLSQGGYPWWAWPKASPLKEWGRFLDKEIRCTKFNMQEVLHCWFENGGDHTAEMAGGFWELITSPGNSQQQDRT